MAKNFICHFRFLRPGDLSAAKGELRDWKKKSSKFVVPVWCLLIESVVFIAFDVFICMKIIPSGNSTKFECIIFCTIVIHMPFFIDFCVQAMPFLVKSISILSYRKKHGQNI